MRKRKARERGKVDQDLGSVPSHQSPHWREDGPRRGEVKDLQNLIILQLVETIIGMREPVNLFILRQGRVGEDTSRGLTTPVGRQGPTKG